MKAKTTRTGPYVTWRSTNIPHWGDENLREPLLPEQTHSLGPFPLSEQVGAPSLSPGAERGGARRGRATGDSVAAFGMDFHTALSAHFLPPPPLARQPPALARSPATWDPSAGRRPFKVAATQKGCATFPQRDFPRLRQESHGRLLQLHDL